MEFRRVLFFFFSSRRRHTRYWRDWSSDVCSSDLAEVVGFVVVTEQPIRSDVVDIERLPDRRLGNAAMAAGIAVARPCLGARSEERRVGKECRSRWSPYH